MTDKMRQWLFGMQEGIKIGLMVGSIFVFVITCGYVIYSMHEHNLAMDRICEILERMLMMSGEEM